MRKLLIVSTLAALVAASTALANDAPALNTAGIPGAEPQPTALPSALPTVGKLFVYQKNSFLGAQPYLKFAAAAHKEHVAGTTLPADLATYDCVLLSLNMALPQSDIDALATYAKTGGNLLAVGEWDAVPQPSGVMNKVAEAAGSGMRIRGGAYDLGFHTTQKIDLHTLTLGVVKLKYAAAARVDTGPTGFSMVKENDGVVTILAAEQVGAGFLVMSGDSNFFGDYDGGGFTTEDNGLLANWVCNGLVAAGVPDLL